MCGGVFGASQIARRRQAAGTCRDTRQGEQAGRMRHRRIGRSPQNLFNPFGPFPAKIIYPCNDDTDRKPNWLIEPDDAIVKRRNITKCINAQYANT